LAGSTHIHAGRRNHIGEIPNDHLSNVPSQGEAKVASELETDKTGRDAGREARSGKGKVPSRQSIERKRPPLEKKRAKLNVSMSEGKKISIARDKSSLG